MDTLPARSRLLRPALIGLGVLLPASLVLLGAGLGATVEVLADDELHEVRLVRGSVADALELAEVDLAADDVVTPEADAEVVRGDRVVVTRAITVEVVIDDGEPVAVTAPVTSVGGILAHAGHLERRDDGSVLTPGWREPVVDGDTIVVRRPAEVVVEVDGDETVVVTLAASVEDLLSLHEVELGPHDVVEPALSAPLLLAPTIVVQRVELVEEVEEVVLEHGEVRRDTSALTRGSSRVTEEGRDGLRLDTFLVTLTDGVETERELTSEEVVTEPVDRVVEVGTAAPARPAPTGVPSADDPVWTRLSQCEANGNWSHISRNGRFYGGLQFHPDTWRKVGGSGMPHQASRAEQIYRAQLLLAEPWATWRNQWPDCSRRLGLH